MTAGAGGLFCVVGVALSYVEVVALGVACLTVVGLAVLWTLYRPSIAVDRSIDPPRVEVSQRSRGTIQVTNTSPRPSLPAVVLDLVAGEEEPVPIPALASGEARQVGYDLPTSRRGVVDVGPLLVRRSDPFGFARYDQRHGDVQRLYVRPRTAELVPPGSAEARNLDGTTAEVVVRGTEAFHQVRAYVPGDDRRMIHWPATARTGELMVRQHVDTSLPDLTIVLDTRAGSYAGEEFEVAVEITASLAVACTKHRYPVVIHATDGRELEVPQGPAGTAAVLDQFAAIDVRPAAGPVAARITGSGHAVALIAGQLDEGDHRSLAPLRRRYQRVLVVSVHPAQAGATRADGIRHVHEDTLDGFALRWNGGGLW